jgi:hypothetical protein
MFKEIKMQTKKFLIGTVMLSLLFSLAFIACDPDPDNKLTEEEKAAQEIVGTWLCSDFSSARYFAFESNKSGKFTNTLPFDGSAVTFSYTYNGTTLVISNSSDTGPIPNGDYPATLGNNGQTLTIFGGGQNQIYNKQP